MTTTISHILCPFCSAPWSDENMQFYDLDAGDHCESGRFGPETVSIQITCHACNRLMFQKDGVDIS